MAVFRPGEQMIRPGVHIRIINRSETEDDSQIVPPEDINGIIVICNSDGTVTMKLQQGCTVTHDGNNTVTLYGLAAQVTQDEDGNVTIGGQQ